MPKGFIYFLVIAQLVIIFLHAVAFALFLFFFPALANHYLLIAIVLALLSISFLTFSLLTHNRHIMVLTAGYRVAAVWIVFLPYFLSASIVTLFLYIIQLINPLTAGYIALAVSSGLTIYGVINARITRIIKVDIALPNLPAYWKNKTAVMVSDLHLGQVLRTGFADKVIRLTNKLNPDIVFIPGDFFDGVHTDFVNLANDFKQVKAPLGIYFCSGNHELFAGYDKCEKAIRESGIKILENQVVEVEGLQIAGVAYKKEIMPDLAQTLATLNLDRNKPSILLKHVPAQMQEISEAGFNFMLSGHSHHGQIWPGSLITKKYWKGYDYGYKTFEKLQIYISSGVGTGGPPMRVFTKSEIVKITFVQAK